MTAQAAGDVRQDRVAILELDGERRAGEYLFYGAEDFERSLFRGLGGLPGPGLGFGIPRTDNDLSL